QRFRLVGPSLVLPARRRHRRHPRDQIRDVVNRRIGRNGNHIGYFDMFSATAAQISTLNAASSTSSPLCRSMARRVPPSRLALNRPEGSSSAAPLANVSLILSLYVSPVQMRPPCDHVGTPPGLEGFLQLTSSTTAGSASLISLRIRPSASPRQSGIAASRSSIS